MNTIQKKPYVHIEAQGRLLRVQAVGIMGEAPFPGKRGLVDEFSHASRLRLLQLLARIKPPDSTGYRFKVSFLTLTTQAIFHPRVAKHYLKVFVQQMRRKYPTLAVVWRMEYQSRGAPHFHLILYNAPWMDKEMIQSEWGLVVGQQRPFTRIERVKSYRQLMAYAGKYVAKQASGISGFNSDAYSHTPVISGLDLSSPGRVWGVIGRDNLPMAELVDADIPNDDSWWLIRRYCQNMYEWIPDDYETGFTVFCDDPYHALKHIVGIQRAFERAARGG